MGNNMEPSVQVTLSAGDLLLTAGVRYVPEPFNLSTLLIEGAAKHPQSTLIAEKDARGDYVHLSYESAYAQARGIAAQLIGLGGDQSTPLLILSGASIEHFVVSWGAILAGVPYVPVSTNYSTVPPAFDKLQGVFEKSRPRFVWSECYTDQSDALNATGIMDADLIWLGEIDRPGGTPLTKRAEAEDESQIDARIRQLGRESVARYMFTSGSTGSPKGVIHTHGMIGDMLAARRILGEDDPNAESPRVLDWMPWSHVGAGVLRLAFVMQLGGAVFIDDGKPVPGEFAKTVDNLKRVKPTSYSGAPLGWSMLVEALEQDESLALTFFAHVQSLAYGSAAMPPSTYERLQKLLVQYQGARKSMSTSLQSTEVAVGLSRYWPCEDQTVVGLPMPGATFKLIPVGDRYELRVKGAGVTPGYINDPERTAEAFDDQGYFKMGDAVSFANPDNPSQGLRFAGRIAEQFKLQSGTWVSAGSLRAQLVASCAPWVRDVVVCGVNEAFIGLLVWPNVAACSRLTEGDQEAASASSEVIEAIRQGLSDHNAEHSGSSQRVERFLLLDEPPSVGDGEITEKGYVNQGLVQRRRNVWVRALYASSDIAVWPV